MYDIIYNPTSGTGKAQKVYNKVVKILAEKGLEYTAHPTHSAKDATEITSTLNRTQAFTNLIVLGGDGTFNEALNGITDFSKISLGLVPAGTGNDYAKAKGISASIEEAMANIIDGKPTYTDYIQCQNKRALNSAGAGMDTDVLVKYNKIKFFKGKIKYYIALVYVALHLNFHEVTVYVDDKIVTTKVFLVAVANGKYIGGGMPVAPQADTDDGFLDVVVVSEIPHYKVFNLMFKFLKGAHIKEPCTQCFHTKNVKVTVNDGGATQIDGEVQKESLLDCHIVTDQLKIFNK